MIRKPGRPVILLLATLALALWAHPGASKAGSDEHAGAAAGPYMGQTPPGVTPVLFAPGLVNTEAIELNGVFSPEGHEFFFTRIVDDVFTMHRSVLGNDGWSRPRPVHPYAGGERVMAVDMAYSTDGQELYFLGRGSTDLVPGEHNGLNLWVSERKGDGWSTARVVPPPVSTEHPESYPCTVSDGSLYFSSRRPGGHGASDIYRAQRLADGTFAEPINVGLPINTEHSEGGYIRCAGRELPDRHLGSPRRVRPRRSVHLLPRRKTEIGARPVNLGESINSEQVDFCPMVTPDGKYLFFSRRWGASWDETTRGEVFWVDARVLDRLTPR